MSTKSPTRLLVASTLALILAPALVNAAGSGPHALACLIQPDKMADIGSPVIGVVESIELERGDSVTKGQVVATLRADVERATTDVARSRATSEGELRGAQANLKLAKIKYDRVVALEKEHFVSSQLVEEARSELDIASQRVKFAQEQLATSSRELTVSQAQVSQRTVRSPIDGVVVERYVNPGERVEEKPMLRIADVSVLRVEVVAPTSLFGRLSIGQELTVQPDLPGSSPRVASISQIDKVLDPASNTFRLRLSLPNEEAPLPAGLRCNIDLTTKPSTPVAEPSLSESSVPAAARTATGR